nr:hypothetical protein [Tanacetum cinerariifolium]
NGLLCLYGSRQDAMNEKIAVLWNPCAGKTVSIPISIELHLRNRHTNIGFGVCPNTSDPKLVRINTIGFPFVFAWELEVFTLSARVWKTVSNIPLAFRTCHLTYEHVFVEGFIYWHAYYNIKFPPPSLIISFDLESHEFGEVSLPARVHYTVLELRKNGEVIIENTDVTNSFVIEVYEPSSGRSSGVGINGSFYSFLVNSYMEMLLLLDESFYHSLTTMTTYRDQRVDTHSTIQVFHMQSLGYAEIE